MQQTSEAARAHIINSSSKSGGGACVVYVMSRDQRAQNNYALQLAQACAQKQQLPLVVFFILYQRSNRRSREHITFMLEGLNELHKKLLEYGIPCIVQPYKNKNDVLARINKLDPYAIYADMNPLKRAKNRIKWLSQSTNALVQVVDAHNIVPVWVASEKQEYAARTIRPKLYRQFDSFLVPAKPITRQAYPHRLVKKDELKAPTSFIDTVEYQKSGITHAFTSGEKAAQRALNDFIDKRLRGYATNRNNPNVDGLSNLSPYLHFGQLSSMDVVLRAQEALQADSKLQQDVDALIEEIFIRKELSDNYCYYNKQYDSIEGAPDWAKTTLEAHKQDPREFIYSKAQFEHAQTHDDAWNAAQIELTRTGKMHGYMRMYWAKKVLEWSDNPADAHSLLCYMNDFYSLDGGDPNGYVGILWAVAGLHDRPWQERPVYGTIRSMVYAGLQRKFDVQQYVDKYYEKY